jgi:hypothetical protein
MRAKITALLAVAIAAAMFGASAAQAQMVTVLRPATTVYLPTFGNPVVMPSTPSSVYATGVTTFRPVTPVTTYYAPATTATTTYYAPTTTYYAPTTTTATTTYYAPTTAAATTTYYAPTTTYYAPTTAYYAPTTTATTTYYAPTTAAVVPTTTYMVPAATTYVIPTGRRVGLLRPIVVTPLPRVVVVP